MGYWLKSFTDRTEEKGTDRAIATGTASWSRGCLSNISSVELSHGEHSIKIIGEGSFWQSDTYESVFRSNTSVLRERRIEKLIQSTDTHFRVTRFSKTLDIYFNLQPVKLGKFFPILPHMYGKWLIAELNLRTLVFRYFIRDGRL